MNTKTLCVFLFFSAFCIVARASGPDEKPTDPLQQLTNTFPDTVELKNKGRLLEFCPDGTCDGFVASNNVPVSTLRDFAYLYEYFFSDYTFLGEWRDKQASKKTAERVLAKPEYHKCKNDDGREAARCVLSDLSRNGRIQLIFIRYDEGQRNVVRRNITEQLSEKKVAPKQQTPMATR